MQQSYGNRATASNNPAGASSVNKLVYLSNFSALLRPAMYLKHRIGNVLDIWCCKDGISDMLWSGFAKISVR